MSANCIPSPHQSILCIFQFSPFVTKYTLLAMWILWLVSLTFLAIQAVDLLSNIIIGSSSGTISGYLLKIHELISWNVLKTAVATVATEVRHTHARIKCAHAREKRNRE